MFDWSLRTPIAFLIFNRPDTTARVFEAIRQARPPKLLIVADGPRANRPGEAGQCAATRAIVEQIDWECEVLRNYADTNLGCRERIASGLDWVFANVQEAIVLEDDCLPHPTFFRFCEELLDTYRDDERVMHISGDNFQLGRRRTNNSYYFSRYSHVWGWATWRRAWQHYDVRMQRWPELRRSDLLASNLGHPAIIRYWERTLQAVYMGKIDTWDCQWAWACWVNRGMSILPEINLVSNIGFGRDAHHTYDSRSPFANMLVYPMDFPISHPDNLLPNQDADLFTFYHHYKPRLLSSTKSILVSVIKPLAWRAWYRRIHR